MKTFKFKLIFLSTFIIFNLKGQNCNDKYLDAFEPNKKNGEINWNLFPDFKLPYKIIYGGPINNTPVETILNKGYSHLSDINYVPYIDKKNRAIIYYNPCLIAGQPINELRSPWGNDMSLFQSKWLNDIQTFKNKTLTNTQIDSDIFVFDIEKQYKYGWQILFLKREESTPQAIKSLSDQDFILRYSKDLQAFYASITSFFIENGLNPNNTQISSYSDSPIWNNYEGISLKSWNNWTSDPNNLNFLLKDFNKNSIGGSYFNTLGFFMPTAYYYYDYPDENAKQYLAYLLFQIEVNKAWTTKEIVPFVWLKYNSSTNIFKKPIKNWMAEASAIFPFFWGASGVWLWEDPTDKLNNEVIANYEYFNKGLYRISKFNEYFKGNYTKIPATNSQQLFVNKSPVWKGIIKENKILIVAHNPFAVDENAVSKLVVKNNNWSQEISLKGYEIHLCEYDMGVITNNEPIIELIKVYPNPTKGNLNIECQNLINGNINFLLFDNTGRLIWSKNENLKENKISFEISDLNSGVYNFHISSENFQISRKIVFQ